MTSIRVSKTIKEVHKQNRTATVETKNTTKRKQQEYTVHAALICDMRHSPHFLPFLLFRTALNLLLPLELFVYLRLIIGTVSLLCVSAHLTVLPLLNPVLNLAFSLLPITSSHSYQAPQIRPSNILSLYKYYTDVHSEAYRHIPVIVE